MADAEVGHRRYRIARPGTLEMVEEPPPPLGPNDVLVRMRAASLNYRDLLVLNGPWPARDTTGMVPISDGAGQVAAIGAEVRRFRTGDGVVPIFRPGWIDGFEGADVRGQDLGGGADGVLSEWGVFDEEQLAAKPDALSYEEAATFPCAAVTAWHGLMHGAPLRPGQTVLVQGTGGVSLFALQLARVSGARVIATTSSEDKARLLREFGAETVINYRDEPEWQNAVLKATDGKGVDRVIEVGGSGTLQRSLACTRMGGEVALIGLLETAALIDPRPVMSRMITLRGITVGSRADTEAAMRCFVANGLHPLICRRFPFDQAAGALRFFEERRHTGKVVVTIGSPEGSADPA